MYLTLAQYQSILSRLTALEEAVNRISTAITGLVSLQQVNQLQTILQQSTSSVQTELEALALRVTAIEEDPLD